MNQYLRYLRRISPRNLILIGVMTMTGTWALAYGVWIYQPTPNSMGEQLRHLGLGFFLLVSISQVGLLARPLVSYLISRSLSKAR